MPSFDEIEERRERAMFEWEVRDHDDPDPDRSAYEPTDPKHPDWHSIHADIWDAREKCE